MKDNLIAGLNFGGPKAWAYEILSDAIELGTKVFGIYNPDASYSGPISDEISRTVEEEAFNIIDGEFIDFDEVLCIASRVDKLGNKRAIKLLRVFGSIRSIRSAGIDQLKKIQGIGPILAKRIKENL